MDIETDKNQNFMKSILIIKFGHNFNNNYSAYKN